VHVLGTSSIFVSIYSDAFHRQSSKISSSVQGPALDSRSPIETSAKLSSSAISAISVSISLNGAVEVSPDCGDLEGDTIVNVCGIYKGF
jgi:hypothetical protein